MNKMFRVGIMVTLILSATSAMAKGYRYGGEDYDKAYRLQLERELSQIDASIPRYPKETPKPVVKPSTQTNTLKYPPYKATMQVYDYYSYTKYRDDLNNTRNNIRKQLLKRGY